MSAPNLCGSVFLACRTVTGERPRNSETKLTLCDPSRQIALPKLRCLMPPLLAGRFPRHRFRFLGELYWHIMDFEGNVVDNRQQPGKSVDQDWAGLPGNLDAALTLADGQTLFYKEDKFYVFWNKLPREPYTGLIGTAFPQIPSDLDAAFMSKCNR